MNHPRWAARMWQAVNTARWTHTASVWTLCPSSRIVSCGNTFNLFGVCGRWFWLKIMQLFGNLQFRFCNSKFVEHYAKLDWLESSHWTVELSNCRLRNVCRFRRLTRQPLNGLSEQFVTIYTPDVDQQCRCGIDKFKAIHATQTMFYKLTSSRPYRSSY